MRDYRQSLSHLTETRQVPARTSRKLQLGIGQKLVHVVLPK